MLLHVARKIGKAKLETWRLMQLRMRTVRALLELHYLTWKCTRFRVTVRGQVWG